MLNNLNKKIFVLFLIIVFFALPTVGGFIIAQDSKPNLNLVVQTGHSVDEIAYSPDGKLIATVSSIDRLVQVWEVETGKELRRSQSCLPRSVAFSPRQKILAFGCFQTIVVWDYETGKELSVLKGHSSGIYSVAFSPDGKILASGCDDKTVKLWNVETGQEIATLSGHTDAVKSVVFSPDGKSLATGSLDKTIKLWNVTGGKEIKTIQAYSTNIITSLAFSPNGDILASGASIPLEVSVTSENTVKLWDISSGLEIKKLSAHKNRVFSVAFSPDGKTLVAGGEGQNYVGRIDEVDTPLETDLVIKLFDIETGKFLSALEGKSRTIKAVAFSPDGKYLAGGGYTNLTNSDDTEVIKFWDFQSRKKIKSLSANNNTLIRVRLSEKGKYLALIDEASSLKLIDIESRNNVKKPLESYQESAFFPVFQFSNNENILASTVGNKGQIALIDTKTGKVLKILAGNNESTQNLAFSNDDKILATCGKDKLVKLWNTETGELIKTLSGHSGVVTSVTFGHNNKLLVSGDSNKTIKIWDLAAGREINTLNSSHETAVIALWFSEDGKVLKSSDGRTITEWEIATGKEIKTEDLGGYSEPYSIAKTPNGQISTERVMPKTIRFYDEKNNKVIASLITLSETDWVVITPDGRFDATEDSFNSIHYSYGLEIIELNQLKEMYYEPNLLAKIMGYSKELLRPIIPLKNVRLYPEVVEQKVDPKTKKLTIKLKNRGGGFGAVKVFVNDKLVIEDARDAKLRQNPTTAEQFVTLTADLKDGAFFNGKLCEQIDGKEICRENKVTVVTSNYLPEIGKGNISSRGSDVIYLDNENSNNNFKLPNLYAIIGGVSDYTGIELDLSFASKDAEDFANALNLGAKRLFCPQENPNCLNKIQIKTFSTSGKAGTTLPTKENLRNAFAEIAQKAQPEDIVLIYLAGHGVSLSGTDTYFYLTQEARTANKEELAKVFQTTTISSDELLCWLSPVQCDGQKQLQIGGKLQLGIKSLRQVIILDTCASGKAGEKLALTASRDLTTDQRRAIEFLKDKSGTHILMGSTADKPSYEASQFGQGLLTRALLEGMSGAALQKPNGFIDVQTLFRYAETRVPQLAQNIGGVQMPTNSSPLGKTFVIGQIGDTESKEISRKLPVPKPFVLRPSFGNSEEDNFDSLGINSNLAKLLNDENNYLQTRGQSALVFLNEDSFPGAIKPTGLYTIIGENVRVKGSLRCEGQRSPFEVEDTKQKIVEKLLATIRQELGKIKPESCQVK